MSAETDGCGPGAKGRGYHHGRLAAGIACGGPGLDVGTGSGRVHMWRKRPSGWRHRRRALSAFRRPQRPGRSAGATRFRKFQRPAQSRLGWRAPRCRSRRCGDAAPPIWPSPSAEPGLYKAMFGDAGFLAQPGGASGPAQKAFDDLSGPPSRFCVIFMRRKIMPAALAVQIWAMTHGVAELMLAGHFGDQAGRSVGCAGDGGRRADRGGSAAGRSASRANFPQPQMITKSFRAHPLENGRM